MAGRPPPTIAVSVVSVVASGDNAVWTFSHPLAAELFIVTGLEIDTGSGHASATNTIEGGQAGQDFITLQNENPVAGGQSWRATEEAAGWRLKRLRAPQTGTVG